MSTSWWTRSGGRWALPLLFSRERSTALAPCASGFALAGLEARHDHDRVEPAVIRLARPRRGHFDLGTGYHGDLWLDLDALFLRPALLRPHARWLADRLAGHEIDAVCGPMEGGAFLAQTVADLLEAAFVPARHCPAPRPGALAGYCLPRGTRDQIGGWRVAIVDDAINAGTAVRACFQQIRDGGAACVALAALLSLGPASAAVAATMSVPFYSVATMPSNVWPAGSCPLCASGVPLADPPLADPPPPAGDRLL